MPGSEDASLARVLQEHDYITDDSRLLEVIALRPVTRFISVQDALTDEYEVLRFAEIDSGPWHQVHPQSST